MGKRLICLAAILLILSVLPVLAEDSVPVRIAMPSKATGSPVLPYDRVIGQVVEPECDDSHVLLSKALGEAYSFEWTESHIAPEVRSAIVRLFDSWFSTHLPCSFVLMSASHVNADGSTGINVRADGSCMSFVLSGGMIVSMKELDF
ncbi:MAG: hypothetical protein ILP16_07055 [Spirochaetales bacterium]|nr:hypothetical protein [Spirochaetales bacterium]